MFNNQKTNKNAVQLLSDFNEAWGEEIPEEYYRIALEAVKQNPMALGHVNTRKNNEYYYCIALEAVKQTGLALNYVNKNWASNNPELYKKIALEAVSQNGMALYALDAMILLSTQYYDIVLEAVNQNGLALRFVDKNWASNNPELYKEIALEAVSQNGMALEHVNTCKNNEYYYDIALAAVNQRGYALEYVNKDWAVENPEDYYKIALAAVSQNGMALQFASKDLKNNYDIVMKAVQQEGLALQFAEEAFRNNIKIAISSLIRVDSKHSKYGYVLTFEGVISKILGMTSIKNDILLYVHMFNNQNVSNKFKNGLFNSFIKEFEHYSDNFKLYKNILECYLFLSKGYQTDFLQHQLLEDLSKDDSKQLHMFLSLADPSALSALKNDKLAKFSNNDHNDIIKNYLTKDTHNLKSIKNFNIYSSLLPKNLFVINYDKIIKKINENNINIIKNDDLMRLILCYSRIEDSLKLSEALNLGDKLQVKYLDIVPKFEREGVTSTGIEAFVDAITSQKGYLSNKGNYQYDTCSTIYNLLDIELSQHNKLIE